MTFIKNFCGSLELKLSEFYAKGKFERNVHSCFYHLSSLVASPHFLINHSNYREFAFLQLCEREMELCQCQIVAYNYCLC